MKKLTLVVMTTCGVLGATMGHSQSGDPAAWDAQGANYGRVALNMPSRDPKI